MDVLIVRLVDFDDSARLPRLFVTRGDSTVPVEFNSSGEALILVEDDDLEEVRLHNEQFEHTVDMGSIRLAATPKQFNLINIPPLNPHEGTPTLDQKPPPSTFRTRVQPKDLESAGGAK